MANRIACARAAAALKTVLRRDTIQNIPRVAVKQVRAISLSQNLYQKYFSRDHEWLDVENDVAKVGITLHAQEQLGELVYVELPEVDAEVDMEDPVGTVESVKAASDVLTPVSGTIQSINEQLNDNPGIVNQSPENEGWMFTIALSDTSELDSMMDADAYKVFCEGEETD